MRKPALILIFVAMALLLTGCFGPKPVVRDYSSVPPPAGSDEPYKVEVVLGNAGPGAGEVVVMVDLSNRRTGEIIAQEMKEVDLQQDQTVRTTLELPLPPSLQGLDPQDIDVRVDAHYPIE
jgi:hypothetical protein